MFFSAPQLKPVSLSYGSSGCARNGASEEPPVPANRYARWYGNVLSLTIKTCVIQNRSFPDSAPVFLFRTAKAAARSPQSRPPLRKPTGVRPRRRRSAERPQNGRHDRTRNASRNRLCRSARLFVHSLAPVRREDARPKSVSGASFCALSLPCFTDTSRLTAAHSPSFHAFACTPPTENVLSADLFGAAFRAFAFSRPAGHVPSADCAQLSFSPIRNFYPTKNDSSANCFRRVFQHVHFLPFYKEMFHPPSMHSSSFRAFVFSRPAESGSSAARVWRGFPRVRMSCLMGSIPSVSAAPVFPYRARSFVYRDFETRGCMLSRSAAYTIPATLRRFSPRRH